MRKRLLASAGAGAATGLVALLLEATDHRGTLLVLLTAGLTASLVWLATAARTARLERLVANLDARQTSSLEAVRRELAELHESARSRPDRS